MRHIPTVGCDRWRPAPGLGIKLVHVERVGFDTRKSDESVTCGVKVGSTLESVAVFRFWQVSDKAVLQSAFQAPCCTGGWSGGSAVASWGCAYFVCSPTVDTCTFAGGLKCQNAKKSHAIVRLVRLVSSPNRGLDVAPVLLSQSGMRHR